MSLFCRMVGPEMPSAELLAAAAKLTEAQAVLRYVRESISSLDALYCTLELFDFDSIGS